MTPQEQLNADISAELEHLRRLHEVATQNNAELRIECEALRCALDAALRG